MRIVFIRSIIALSLFAFSFLAKSQTIINLNGVSIETQKNSLEQLFSLINDVQPSVYFVKQEQNLVEEKYPTKIVVDGGLLNLVTSATFNKTEVQLIEVRINNEEDFNLKIDLNSFQKHFKSLKYITFILTYDYCLAKHQQSNCVEKKIEEILQKYPNNNIQIAYLLSVND